MPFDSFLPAEVTARNRVIQLRDFLAVLDPNHFDMHDWEQSAPCGTVACIAGWQGFLLKDRYVPIHRSETFDNFHARTREWIDRMGTSLGLSTDQSKELFTPRWINQFTRDGDEITMTPTQAAAVLDHYLLTGLIDWSIAA